MNEKFKSNTLNALMSIALILFGCYVLVTGNIKSMQLGSERLIPALVVVSFGGWLLSKSAAKILRDKK